MIVSRMHHLTVLALARLSKTGTWRGQDAPFFRFAENTNEGITGKPQPIVHTPAAFNPTAHQAAPKKTA
jgi:hypothetical protein